MEVRAALQAALQAARQEARQVVALKADHRLEDHLAVQAVSYISAINIGAQCDED